LAIGIDKLMLTSASLQANGNKNIYGNALEALMGAIYLDFGYKKCKQFFEQQILSRHIDIDKLSKQDENFKSKIIEWCQKNRLNLEFILLKDELIDTNRHIFEVILKIEGKQISTGIGSNKKEAEQNASFNAIKRIDAGDYFENLATPD